MELLYAKRTISDSTLSQRYRVAPEFCLQKNVASLMRLENLEGGGSIGRRNKPENKILHALRIGVVAISADAVLTCLVVRRDHSHKPLY